MKYLSSNIKDVVNLFKQGNLSPLELCNAALSRQKKISRLNAFVPNELSEIARRSGQASLERYEKGKVLSPLDGITIAVKDNFCTSGIRTSCGSQMLENYVPMYSATVVNRLEKAGAMLIGKTNLDEFAMGSGTVDSTFGPSRNIYHSGIQYTSLDKSGNEVTSSKELNGISEDDWYVAGGSSGGSALAVASGSAFLSLGSDTGGSVRNPAAYCGVVGLKPSYGVVPRHGLISLVNSMDVPGIFGRSVDDTASMLSIVSGLDSQDSTSVASNLKNLKLPECPSVKDLVIGIPKEYHRPNMDPEIINVWRKVADLFENAGAQVREVSLPHTKYSIVCYSILNPCEVASNFTRYTGVEYGLRSKTGDSMESLYALTRSSGLNDVVRGRVLAGNYFLLEENKERYFLQALKVRRLICQDFLNVWNEGINLLLSPVTLSAPMRYSEFVNFDNRTQTAMQDICTQSANMAGVPAVSVPISLNPKSLPLALQIMAPIGNDAVMLSAAKWMEMNVDFPRLCITE